MSPTRSQVDLFHYLDYRRYLRDFYQAKKTTGSSFSFRAFSQRAGFRSPNFFKMVMDGHRNLTEASLEKFIRGLKFNKQEAEFFRNLVFYNQAKGHEERDRYYQKLLQSRKFNQLKPIEKHQYEYYSTWYHPVIRELIAAKEFDGTAEWLAEKIYPRITSDQAEKSLKLLEKLGLVKRTKKGRWKQSSSVISTGPEVRSVTLFNYHLNLLDLSQEILEKVPAPERDISAMTLGVKKERLPEVKKRIQEFRREILALVSTDTHPEEVVQVNIQMYPLTRSDKVKSI